MSIRIGFLLLILSCICIESFGQYDFQPVLADLDGQDLMEQLEDDFRPANVLTYDIARDTLFKRIYGVNDSLACVYTGYRLYLTPGEDPTQAVFMNGNSNGINTEHSWPQSLGAGTGDPRSNMHHLYPTRVDVNSDRASLPFLDIPDNQTEEWYYLGNQQGNVPSSNIDSWSERSATAFEPRESHKGNVARAMMYFKTIYPSAAQQAPNSFFSAMQETLCEWHSQDPVDSLEWHRNIKIAQYQSGKVNPFILDCTLPKRLFCPQVQLTCDQSVSQINIPEVLPFVLYPNPNQGTFVLKSASTKKGAALVSIHNAVGQLIWSENISLSSGQINIRLPEPIASGLYLVYLQNENGVGSQKLIVE